MNFIINFISFINFILIYLLKIHTNKQYRNIINYRNFTGLVTQNVVADLTNGLSSIWDAPPPPPHIVQIEITEAQSNKVTIIMNLANQLNIIYHCLKFIPDYIKIL